MKGLTVLQPWASLIAVGAKRVETRGWRTPYRGPVLITASKAFPRTLRDLAAGEPFDAILRRHGLDPARLPTGVALAVATLARTIPTAGPRTPGIDPAEIPLGYFDPGRSAWCLEHVRPLRHPVKVRGALGLWAVPPEVILQIHRQLGAVA